MAHELELFGDTAAFASFRKPGWHNLGTVFDHEVDTQEMLDIALLSDWNIDLEKITLPHDCYRDYYAVVRTRPLSTEREILGVVGERYKVLQNEELLEFGDNLLDNGGVWETAGSLKHGTLVFASLRMDREIVLDPNGVADRVLPYLLVHTSHDGSVAVQASATGVRVVCANTFNMAMRGVKQTFKVRHTQTLEGRLKAAKEALSLGNEYFDRAEAEMTDLIQTKVTQAQFDKVLAKIMPEPKNDSKIATTKYNNKIEAIRNIYTGETNGMIAGTAWGVLNAFTERLDWGRTGRGDFAEENMAAARAGFDPVTNAERSRILKIVKATVKV